MNKINEKVKQRIGEDNGYAYTNYTAASFCMYGKTCKYCAANNGNRIE